MRFVKRLGTAFLVLLAVVVAASSVPLNAAEPKCYWVCDENTSCNTYCTWDGCPATCGEFGICSGN
jgi:hypothetical protein